MAGSDTYHGETTHAASYRRLKKLYPEKLLAFHECGLIPPAEQFFTDRCPWSWLMPWHTRWLTDNPPERLREVYLDARMIPLSRLTSF